MLKYLWPRLTADPARGSRTFAAVTALARNPAYYRSGVVADTLDGRFAMLVTMTALALVRIERDGEPGLALSVALTERFVEALDAEHREMGMSDPTIGKTIRKLVGRLATTLTLWRSAAAGSTPWVGAARASLGIGDSDPLGERAAELLERDWNRLLAVPLEVLERGELE